MKIGIYILFLFGLACSSTSSSDYLEYINGNQLLNLNEIYRNGDKLESPEIVTIIPDSIFVDEFVKFQITLNSKAFKIAEAYYDCDSVSNPVVDTSTLKIKGCETGLLVEKDTINIHLNPVTPGMKHFNNIEILTVDNQNIYRTYKHSFTYKAINKNAR